MRKMKSPLGGLFLFVICTTKKHQHDGTGVFISYIFSKLSHRVNKLC